jgi:hypothetical protein
LKTKQKIPIQNCVIYESKWKSPVVECEPFAWDHIKRATKHHWDQAQTQICPHGGGVFNPITGERMLLPSKQSIFGELESAFRFGFGALMEYGTSHPQWDTDLEIRLAREWRRLNPTQLQTWECDREAIRYAWNYEEKNPGRDDEGEEWKQN